MVRASESGSQGPSAKGAYGLAIEGIERPDLLGPTEPDWPTLTVVRGGADPAPEAPSPRPGTVTLHDDHGEVWIGNGRRVVVERAPLTVRFPDGTPLSDDALVHPYLGLPAAFANRWLGRHVFHGGAFLSGGGAWALLGAKEGGKSSTLAWLLREGHAVLTDDLLVVAEGRVLAGPRCVDLREEAAGRFGGRELGMVGARPRWRLPAPEAPAAVPLRGFVELSWGDEVGLSPLDAGERLAGLVQSSAIRPDPRQAPAFFELAALPAWRFVRPARWEGFDEANERLLAALA